MPVKEGQYGELFLEHKFLQYRLYIEMADSLSIRRQSANSFFLSINTALIAVLGYIKSNFDLEFIFLYILSCISGITLCLIWYQSIKSYRMLSKAKFKVINDLEKNLPVSPFLDEWNILKIEKNRRTDFTNIEKNIPWIYSIVYLTLVIYFLLFA